MNFSAIEVMNSLLKEMKELESKSEKVNYLSKMILKIDVLRSKLDQNIMSLLDEGINPFKDDVSKQIQYFKSMEKEIVRIECFLNERLKEQKFHQAY